MVKPNSKIVSWKPTFKLLSNSSKITRPGFDQWWNLLIIMPRILTSVIRLLSQTVATTFGYRTRKKLTPAPTPSQQTSYQRKSESWWLYVAKTSTMPKNFKNKLMIRQFSLRAMPPAKRFGWIASKLKPSRTASCKQSSLGHSGFSILSGSKLTNWSSLEIGEFMMFSMCHCWSRIPLETGEWTKKLDK